MRFFHRNGVIKHGVMNDGPFIESACDKCDGACCRSFVTIELTPEEYLTLQRLGATRLGYTLMEKFFLEIENGCEFLQSNRCGIYENRPEVCRRFSCREDRPAEAAAGNEPGLPPPLISP